jgi:hypothetical protein
MQLMEHDRRPVFQVLELDGLGSGDRVAARGDHQERFDHQLLVGDPRVVEGKAHDREVELGGGEGLD